MFRILDSNSCDFQRYLFTNQINKISEKSGKKNHFGARLYNQIAAATNIMLGSHAAISGGKSPFTEKVVENLSVRINREAMIKPMAM